MMVNKHLISNSKRLCQKSCFPSGFSFSTAATSAGGNFSMCVGIRKELHDISHWVRGEEVRRNTWVGGWVCGGEDGALRG